MVHLLSSRNRSEFLAVPELVRFTMSIGASGPAPELLVKASSLHLKYLLRLGAARILFLRIASSWLDYGVEIPDDEKHPAVIWSLLEHDDELTALRELLQRPRCMVHLFNDIAVNVAWTEIDLNLSQQNAIDLIESTALHPTNETNAVDEVKERLDAVHGGQPTSFLSFIVSIPTPIEWMEIKSTYVTNRISASHVSIFNVDEGGQQEEIALWLADNLQPTGAIKSPQVHEPGKPPRELADLMLSYQYGAFFIESKALSILGRDEVPIRTKLVRDLIKHVHKASRQLVGGLKNVKRGYRITDVHGVDIVVERTQPPHAIILVPDLTLLVGAVQFGGSFIRGFCAETGGFLHFLDPAELLRVVQAAEMIAARSQTTTRMMAFDFYLMERSKRAVKCESPAMHVLLRFADEQEDGED